MLDVLRQVSFHSKVNLTLMKSSKETVGSTTTQTLQNGRVSKTREGKPGDLIRSYQVVDWLDNLKPSEDDTVLIYYNGHGTMDRLGTHSLQFDPISLDTLDRERLGTLLNQKRARLRMLITDTCSETIDAEDVKFRALARTRERKHNYMEDLFLTHAGFLDITAASPGEVAIGHPDVGGHFTYALFTHGCSPDADKNNDTFITWQEAFDTAGIETDKLFKQASKELSEVLGTRTNRQRTQQPIAYSLPKPLEQPTKPTTEAPPPQIDEPPIVSPEAIEVETTATLNFTSLPSDAEVYIDDAFAGNTPLRDFEIETDGRSTKKIKVSVKARGRKDVVKELWVQRGKSVNHEFTLTKDIPKTITGGDGAEMVLIPAGEFQMGSNDGYDYEKPVHSVYVDAFYMDKYEVTNAQFKKFVDANRQWQKDHIKDRFHDGDYLKHWNGNNYPSGEGNHPVTFVSWYAAMAYAKWAGKRLPTEAEWERAARGGLKGKKYPHGNTITSRDANYDGNVGTPTAVESYPANGYGLYDMAGNVWEWCLDAYNGDFYSVSPRNNPLSGANSVAWLVNNFTNVKSSRVLRGGSWNNTAPYVRVANRDYGAPSNAASSYVSYGFRCARTVSP